MVVVGAGAVVRVTVISAEGSTPREVGAAMLVGLDGIEDTIGGGALENQAIAYARMNRIVPPTTAGMNKAANAISCSAILAVSEVGPRCKARITDTIKPMPKAMRRPGRTRVNQSKTSKCTNGRPATLHPKNSVPTNAVVTMIRGSHVSARPTP